MKDLFSGFEELRGRLPDRVLETEVCLNDLVDCKS